MQQKHARGCLCWQVLQVLMSPCQYVSEVDVVNYKHNNKQRATDTSGSNRQDMTWITGAAVAAVQQGPLC